MERGVGINSTGTLRYTRESAISDLAGKQYLYSVTVSQEDTNADAGNQDSTETQWGRQEHNPVTGRQRLKEHNKQQQWRASVGESPMFRSVEDTTILKNKQPKRFICY